MGRSILRARIPRGRKTGRTNVRPLFGGLKVLVNGYAPESATGLAPQTPFFDFYNLSFESNGNPRSFYGYVNIFI